MYSAMMPGVPSMSMMSVTGTMLGWRSPAWIWPSWASRMRIERGALSRTFKACWLPRRA